MDILENIYNIGQKLLCGRIFFILANTDAYKKLLKTWNVVASRYVDENMNRCCAPEFLANSMNLERKRVREILPILADLDIHLDIHSTYTPSESMAIYSRRYYETQKPNLNVDITLIWLPEIVIGKPLIDIVERLGGKSLAIETGDVNDEASTSVALESITNLLMQHKMIALDSQYELPKKAWKKISIYGSLLVKNDSFASEKRHGHGDKIQKEETIAHDSENNYIAEKESIIIMPAPIHSNISTFIWEEYCFLGEEMVQ